MPGQCGAPSGGLLGDGGSLELERRALEVLRRELALSLRGGVSKTSLMARLTRRGQRRALEVLGVELA